MSHIVSYRVRGRRFRSSVTHRTREAAWEHFMALGRNPAFLGVRIRSVES